MTVKWLRGLLMVLVAAAAIGLAACGGDDSNGNGDGGGEVSREEYEQALTDFGSDFEDAFAQLGSLSGVGSPEEAAGLLAEAEMLTRDAASDLGAIEPPSDVTDPHERLVVALGSLADTFAEGADAAAAGDAGRLAELTSTPPAAIADLEAAAQEIEDAGYSEVE